MIVNIFASGLQEKISGESHQVTSQELRINTQKSRIEELENMLSVSSEQQNALRKQTFTHQDKQELLYREICQTIGPRETVPAST